MSVFGKRYLYSHSNSNPNPNSYTNTNLNQSKNTKSDSLIIMEHQLAIYNYLKSNRAILLFHKMGSGKTISSLYVSIKLNIHTIIIGPKSSKKSFDDDLDKLNILGVDRSKFDFYTYKRIQKALANNFDLFKDRIVIIDEAHHLRNQSQQMMFIINSLVLAKKIILLSGTPIINHPIDLAVLVNIIKNKEVLPTDKSIFDFYYVEEDENNWANTNDLPKINFKNIVELKEHLSNSISYYDPVNTTNTTDIKITINYPTVYLSPAQLIEYRSYIVRLINPLTNRIVHLDTDINALDYNVNFQSLDQRKANAFLTATRQLSNTVRNDTNSPKILAIAEIVSKGLKPAVVYSNFLTNGIYPLSVQLNKLKQSFKIIKGSTSYDKMNQIINDYNNKQFDILLISSAASESITLKNTRQVHIMEPHFNESKINQVIGRTIRYKSHSTLNESDRNINIYHWCSVFPDSIRNKNDLTVVGHKTADEYLIFLSKKKQQLINKLVDIIKTVSI
jgi:superfamily II DNA or RNA helicase